MFNGSIGPWELLLVLAIVLVIFGPKRLPGLGKQLGRGMREFKESITGDRGGGDDDDDEDDDVDKPPAVTAAATTETRPEESQAAASEAVGREPTRGGPAA